MHFRRKCLFCFFQSPSSLKKLRTFQMASTEHTNRNEFIGNAQKTHSQLEQSIAYTNKLVILLNTVWEQRHGRKSNKIYWARARLPPFHQLANRSGANCNINSSIRQDAHIKPNYLNNKKVNKWRDGDN